jgi:hypothetical protein
VDGRIEALTVYNGDLIAGGYFYSAGGIPASSIASWNGTSWSPLGLGFGGGFVGALTVFRGDLVAGGGFTEGGGDPGNSIARWNGDSWISLGSGVSGGYEGGCGLVYVLATYNGDLIAGGNFSHAGDVVANNIARWDGTSWNAMGSGLISGFVGQISYVSALTVYNGSLIAGGHFTYANNWVWNVARWDGTSWSPLGSGMDNDLSVLTVYGGDLFAGGVFTQAGGNWASHIARWDGASWHPVDAGIDSNVFDLTAYNADLVAGGGFHEAGDNAANFIARWDGTSWNALGSGTDDNIYAVFPYDEALIAGGNFRNAGGNPAAGIARWDEPPKGACCVSAVCEVYTPANCAAHGGTYQGNGTLCVPDPCPTSAVEGGTTNASSLHLTAIPNPSTGQVVLQYHVPRATAVTIEIFSAAGTLVRRMVEGARAAGRHAIPWDARDENGHDLPSGVYLARLVTSDGTAQARAVIAR